MRRRRASRLTDDDLDRVCAPEVVDGFISSAREQLDRASSSSAATRAVMHAVSGRGDVPNLGGGSARPPSLRESAPKLCRPPDSWIGIFSSSECLRETPPAEPRVGAEALAIASRDSERCRARRGGRRRRQPAIRDESADVVDASRAPAASRDVARRGKTTSGRGARTASDATELSILKL